MNRLRHRMILAASVVALLPAIPLSVLTRNLLARSFSTSLPAEVDAALEAALEISRDELRREKAILSRIARGEADGAGTDDARALEATIAPDGTVRGELPAEVARWARTRAEPDRAVLPPERVGTHLVAIVPGPDGARVLARPLGVGVAERAGRITDALSLLRALEAERGAVLTGYIVPFVLSYALLLALAAALAGVMAKRIARPVEALADAARRVGGGNLETRVEARAPGEVGDLVHAFNGMVAELREQRSELARLARLAAWRDLARSLAHEIKNPLTPIQLAIQQLGDAAPAREDPQFRALLGDCVEIVDEEVEALRRLVREFSEFARLPTPVLAPGDLAALLDDLKRLYGDRMESVPEARPLPGHFDEAELRRALINLIENGLAACREAGRPERVRLTASAGEEGSAVIRVTDDGGGVPEANRERIFEPNFSTKSEGMGLGLAIVDGIVRAHGGTIELEPAAERGAAFAIRLPADTGGDR